MPEKAEACEHCIKRRSSRIEAWKQNPAQTIWIDEIADHNDRVALIVGRFGLDDWLSGDLVQTMLVKAVPGNPNDCVLKKPLSCPPAPRVGDLSAFLDGDGGKGNPCQVS